MTKEVLICISGSHIVDGEKNLVEVIVPGSYYFTKGKHFLVYDEIEEPGTEPIHNLVKIGSDFMEVIKNGDVNTKMQFKKMSPFFNRYVTPMGEMMLEMDTNEINIKVEENSMRVEVHYELKMNYQHVSDCVLTMKVYSKEMAELNLNENLNKK